MNENEKKRIRRSQIQVLIQGSLFNWTDALDHSASVEDIQSRGWFTIYVYNARWVGGPKSGKIVNVLV